MRNKGLRGRGSHGAHRNGGKSQGLNFKHGPAPFWLTQHHLSSVFAEILSVFYKYVHSLLPHSSCTHTERSAFQQLLFSLVLRVHPHPPTIQNLPTHSTYAPFSCVAASKCFLSIHSRPNRIRRLTSCTSPFTTEITQNKIDKSWKIQWAKDVVHVGGEDLGIAIVVQ